MTRWPATCCGWVVRHGQSAGNASGVVQGQSRDEALTRLGQVQARRIAQAFPRGLRPRIVSSDLRRARETAAALCAATGTAAEFSPALRERALGVLEGTPWDRVDPAAIGIRDGVVTDPDVCPDGGESIRAFVERVCAGLAPVASAHRDGTPAVVIAHGGVVRVAAALRAGLPAIRAGVPATGDPLVGLAWPAMQHARPLPCCLADLVSRARTELLCRTP